MNWLYIPIGLLIGIVVAAPVGPVNLICINRTFKQGPWQGFAVGVAAAIGDGVFALLAAAGYTEIADQIAIQRDMLRLIGGFITIGFAWFVWRSAPHLEDRGGPSNGWLRQSFATFTMTITNPATLAAFLAIFAGYSFNDVSLRDATHITNLTILVSSVFLGSLTWWLGLCHGAARLRDRISDNTLIAINHATAILLLLFACAAIFAGLHD